MVSITATKRSLTIGVRAALFALTAAILAAALTVFRADALPPAIDLDSTSANLTVFGQGAFDNSGRSVAAGDINGDTTDDLIIGARGAGAAYVIYGSSGLPATIDLNSASAGLTVLGEDPGDRFGVAVAAGDINGDTTDDLIIGADEADPGGRDAAGRTYVIYGGPGLPATIDLSSTSADLTVLGDDFFDESGEIVAAGDINGDGTDDLIIGASQATPAAGFWAGESYVIYGGASLPAIIDLSSTSPDLIVYGEDRGDRSGQVAAADIDGDTTDDLIIGAFNADGPGAGTCSDGGTGSRCSAGQTYVIYGGAGLPATIDLSSTSADLAILGDDRDDRSTGRAAGDINGDTIDDLIIAAVGADPPGGDQAGETYVIYGGAGLPAIIDLDTTPAGLTVYGDDVLDRIGASAAGDIDGDGTDDLIIGAFDGDGSGAGTDCGFGTGDRCEAGETYVIYGGPTLPATIDLNSTSAGLTVYGDDFLDRSGFSVAAGDINSDGIDDLIIGAAQADGSGIGTDCGTGQVGDRCSSGETYVIFGGPQGPTPTPTATVPPTDTPVPPTPPVGGIAFDPDPSALALTTPEASSGKAGLAGIAAAVATGVVALGGAALGAAWYARRRVRC